MTDGLIQMWRGEAGTQRARAERAEAALRRQHEDCETFIREVMLDLEGNRSGVVDIPAVMTRMRAELRSLRASPICLVTDDPRLRRQVEAAQLVLVECLGALRFVEQTRVDSASLVSVLRRITASLAAAVELGERL
jgi:hypothetical protein